MENILQYAKKAQSAFKTYTQNENMDYNECEKNYNYIMNIEDLDYSQRKDLENFIRENTFDIVHVANIYMSGALNKQLTRMLPIRVSRTNANIYEARGVTTLKDLSNVEQIKVKRKTHTKK